jgi:hypothetical protein
MYSDREVRGQGSRTTSSPKKRLWPRQLSEHMETAMSGKKLFVAIAAAALGVLSTTAAWSNFDGRHHKGGFVNRCSLDGVNPAFHPDIFGNAAVAAEYGFIRSRDGSWRVKDNCVRGVTVPY